MTGFGLTSMCLHGRPRHSIPELLEFAQHPRGGHCAMRQKVKPLGSAHLLGKNALEERSSGGSAEALRPPRPAPIRGLEATGRAPDAKLPRSADARA
mmetsp:Transcript_2176/g.4983  ORF Transcript_2176/g.4983 Transcript_2176/m.4983 type:complete len:97 (+) Transcript_2176:2110-2400(+)